MATVGYYSRANGVRADDGTLVCADHWALIRVNDKYADEVVVDGLPKEEATALYWRKLAKLVAEKTAASDAAGELPLAGNIGPKRRSRQLSL